MSGFIIQAIGFTGMAFFIASYQMRSNRMLFLFQLIGCLIFIAQFSIMGAYTGALGLAVNVLRNLLLLRIDKWKWVESKITLSVVISSIGYWTNNAQKIRASQLCASPWTLIYDAIIGS